MRRSVLTVVFLLSALDLFAIELKTDIFTNKGYIPERYTCDGEDVSVPLSWSGVPKNTKSLVVICDDPDAPFTTWTHWVLFNIPPSVTSIPEGGPKGRSIDESFSRGLNDFGEANYGGACPPKGKPHRYFFKIYALDKTLTLSKGANKKEIEKAMVGHILAEDQIYGLYQRK